MSEQNPLAVRIETASKIIDTSPATITYWVRTGRLPAHKVGRSYRILLADLKAFVDRKGTAQ
jgi:excisionase family DNA binding protein